MEAVKVIFDITNMEDNEAEKVSTYLGALNGVTGVEMIHPHGNGHKETHEFSAVIHGLLSVNCKLKGAP